MPFIRVYRLDEHKEIFVDTAKIWKIEVTYGVPKGETVWRTTLEQGTQDPDAIRMYRVFVGSETILLPGNVNDPVLKEIEDICKNAIKAGSQP